jgi:hypothetical protein
MPAEEISRAYRIIYPIVEDQSAKQAFGPADIKCKEFQTLQPRVNEISQQGENRITLDKIKDK